MPKKSNVTFFSKHTITCPSCKTEFNKEELQTGRGRINAGELTVELRRLYIPTQKFGIVNPLIYPIIVCPNCLLAGYANDFQKFDADMIPNIQADAGNRHEMIKKAFGRELDFREFRDTPEGLASYMLGFASTIFLPRVMSPTARRGLYALRAAWLAGDLYKQSGLEHFKELSDAMYYQAYVNYDRALELQIRSIEPFDGFAWMGPDIDTNFGYDGLLYIISYLSMMFLDKLQPEARIAKIGNVKRVLSRIFGVGKIAKSKPQVLIVNAKNLYHQANNILEELSKKGLDTSIADEIENQEE